MISRQSFLDQNSGRTELMNAIISEDLNLVEALLLTGADIEARDRQGQNALYYTFTESLCSNTLKILDLLISHGVNLNASLDGDGCSALVTAVILDWPEVISILLENGANVNEDAMAKTEGSLNSDTESKKSSDQSITTQFIFSKGCGHTVTPLLCAVMYEKEKLIKTLLSFNASCSSYSYGTFWRAKGSSVCSSCDVKVTPLHMAAYTGNLNIMHLLLENEELDDYHYNCNVENENNRYFTIISPLWLAIVKGHENIVKLLLSMGKTVTLQCHFGSGLQVCLEEGHINLAHMLLRAGYDLNEDLDWIEEKQYPCSDEVIIEQIEDLVNQPRRLLDCCTSALRHRFGLGLNAYLKNVGAPNKVIDIVNFNDLSLLSLQNVI